MRWMIWIALSLPSAACVPPIPVAATPQVGIAPLMTCHLADAYHGTLTWGNELARLQCTATNVSTTEYREICARPFVGVRTTGAIHTPHGMVCSSQLAPGEVETYFTPLDFLRSSCSRDGEAGGCIVKVFGDNPSDIVAFARAMQAEAPAAGRDQPTLDECDAAIASWRGNPQFTRYAQFLDHAEDFELFCTGLSRAMFDCMRTASDDTHATACGGD